MSGLRALLYAPVHFMHENGGNLLYGKIPHAITSHFPAREKWMYVSQSLFHSFYTSQVDTSTRSYYLEKLEYKNRSLIFDKGLALQVFESYNGNLYTIHDRRFNIYGSGQTPEDAYGDYSQFFIELYEDIINTPDDELPQSTLDFKKTLKCFAVLQNGPRY